MFDVMLIVCMLAALICSIILLCMNCYDIGYNKGYNASEIVKKKKTTKKR
jgi:hypothetical protein